MTDLYEFGVSGRVGPALRTCLPDLELVADGPSTVLTGTVGGPEGLQRILDLLTAVGVATTDLRLTASTHDHPTPAPKVSAEQVTEW